MDDLIVILLTLIIAAAGAIGQFKKKKKEVSGTSPEEQKSGGDIWDMFTEGVFPEEPKPETVPEVEELEDEYEEKYEPYINEQKYEFKANNEGGNIINNQSEPEETKTIKKGIKIKKDFSLRKAVIYSEILNRKYK